MGIFDLLNHVPVVNTAFAGGAGIGGRNLGAVDTFVEADINRGGARLQLLQLGSRMAREKLYDHIGRIFGAEKTPMFERSHVNLLHLYSASKAEGGSAAFDTFSGGVRNTRAAVYHGQVLNQKGMLQYIVKKSAFEGLAGYQGEAGTKENNDIEAVARGVSVREVFKLNVAEAARLDDRKYTAGLSSEVIAAMKESLNLSGKGKGEVDLDALRGLQPGIEKVLFKKTSLGKLTVDMKGIDNLECKLVKEREVYVVSNKTALTESAISKKLNPQATDLLLASASSGRGVDVHVLERVQPGIVKLLANRSDVGELKVEREEVSKKGVVGTILGWKHGDSGILILPNGSTLTAQGVQQVRDKMITALDHARNINYHKPELVYEAVQWVNALSEEQKHRLMEVVASCQNARGVMNSFLGALFNRIFDALDTGFHSMRV